MGILGIGIDGTVVLATLVEEVELDDALVSILVALATNEPVVGALGLAGYRNIVGRLGFEVAGVVPVASHVSSNFS